VAADEIFWKQKETTGDQKTEHWHMRTYHDKLKSNSDEGLNRVDNTIRGALDDLNRCQAGVLRVLFLTGEEEKKARQFFAGQLSGDLKRLDAALRQSEPKVLRSEIEAALRR
jgi:hypothetical protein